MAGSEGTNQTELFTGWSSVVHQPCEDPEETDLPSTVDIAAFSTHLNVEPANTSTNNDNTDSESDSEADTSNSGSELSQSESQSDSTDSDSTTSSQESSSRSPTPEFSVTSSQTNGLRLTIATVKKSCNSPSNEKPAKITEAKTNKISSSSESVHTSASESDSSESHKSNVSNNKNKSAIKDTSKKIVNKTRTKNENKREDKKSNKKEAVSSKSTNLRTKVKSKKIKKMASLPLSRSYTSSDSEASDADSVMLASCSLQEIRQEDLAAILPDQQECDAFGAFEGTGNHKNSPQEGDMSGSDMELPQQAVNAIIERTTETNSDSESHSPPNPSSLFANSLLQQFEAQTQMLSTSCQVTSPNETANTQTTQNNKDTQIVTKENDVAKRKRGRPRKNKNKTESRQSESLNTTYSGSPNVSPDSGIQNSPDHISSPEPTLNNKTRNSNESKKATIEKVKEKGVNDKSNKKDISKTTELSKISVSSNRFDRLLYGNTERVLYPPRRKAGRPPQRKGPGRPPKSKTNNSLEKSPEKNKTTEDRIAKSEQKHVGKKTHRIDTVRNNQIISNENKVNGVAKEPVPKKSKSNLLLAICERVSKRLELHNNFTQKATACKPEKHHKNSTKLNARTVLSVKNKFDKPRFATMKNSKVMHSKHRHKKHKKCKFKILKPLSYITSDPKINLEVEKLITDFMKLCISNNLNPTKENVPEILKTLKKVSKKRKTNEYERKKKKQNVNTTINKLTNSNEQRLPLKKRHYHLSTTDNKNDVAESITCPISVSSDSTLEKTKIMTNKQCIVSKVEKPKLLGISKMDNVKTIQSPKQTLIIKTGNATSPKVQNINNNEYNVNDNKGKHVGSHIDEAIEACINRFSDGKIITKVEGMSKYPENHNNIPPTTITATTPKKRHRLTVMESNETSKPMIRDIENEESQRKIKSSLEIVVSELKLKRNLSPKLTDIQNKCEKKDESVAQIITRKKNRLEDLTSNLVSKINPSLDADKKKKEGLRTEDTTRASVIKYPACKKAKPTELEKLDTITSAKPTGIFMSTVDLELSAPSPDIAEELKPVAEDVKLDIQPIVKASETEVPSTNQVVQKFSPDLGKKKVRKRRAINRTGFPTVKKKKKKPLHTGSGMHEEQLQSSYDRVPKEGEEYSEFVHRTEKINLSSVLEISRQKSEDIMSKWEVMSECDSLPQDERTEIELDDIKIDVKSIKMNLRHRDSSPATSVDTRISDRSKIKDEDLDDLTLETRVERLKEFNLKRKRYSERLRDPHHPKRRLRDMSPTNSIERRVTEDRASASGDEGKKNRKVPRWRKRYLVAGLFSDYYKEDDEAVRNKRNENVTKSRLLYKPSEHPYGLLPPPYHCGKYLRCRKLPFQLPHDFWWQHTHSQLPGRDIVPSWNYRKIRTNLYNVKSNGGVHEPQSCNCSASQGCGDDCINRLVLSECPANHRCQNQKIQKHEWAPGIEKFMTEDKGWGVRTKLPIKSTEFILEYVGEVVSDQEFKERMATIYIHDTHHYCLHFDSGMVIDGHRMGGDGRFVNHSCQPNCEMQKWSVNGQFRMALFALRDIEAGEELTYDYNFSLFNPAEGQECKCLSDNCRGVIGGKSQRVRQLPVDTTVKNQPGRLGRPRKNHAKKAPNANTNKETKKELSNPPPPPPIPVLPAVQIKPISHQQKCYILEHHCFLLRNITKAKKVKDRSMNTHLLNRQQTATPTDHGATFLNHLNALQKPRNMRTRRIAQAEDDPDFSRSVKLAGVLKDILHAITNAKDGENENLASPFLIMPSKRKVPEFYHRISDPIDFATIEQNIARGVYRSTENFDADMNKVFSGYIKFYGRASEHGVSVTKLKKIYTATKQESLSKFENVLGIKPHATFVSKRGKNEEEDIIRCICGMFHDEGLMIQCEKCLVWQHCECVKADVSAPSYHCETCVPRNVDYEIPLEEFTEHGHRYYMTLLRGDLQLRQGDTVYVLRDMTIPGTNLKHTYKTIKKIDYAELDIFRIERLWRDSKTGQRLAYGHHYLRPHETYHEPTRKFFSNEVMRVPLYEAVPVELIISHCWVLDLNTYCKGRPIGSSEKHIYICEYRVDKSARLFKKVPKSKFPVCTKTYTFERFDERLKISRLYTPHSLDLEVVKPKNKKCQDSEDVQETVITLPSHVPVVRTRSEKRARLNKILLNLLNKLPTKQILDVSYLLEGGRRRKNKLKTVEI